MRMKNFIIKLLSILAKCEKECNFFVYLIPTFSNSVESLNFWLDFKFKRSKYEI